MDTFLRTSLQWMLTSHLMNPTFFQDKTQSNELEADFLNMIKDICKEITARVIVRDERLTLYPYNKEQDSDLFPMHCTNLHNLISKTVTKKE